MVSSLHYLERTMMEMDNGWLEVVENLINSRQKWEILERILGR